MRLSACLLLLSLAGIMGGAALIGLWALGLAIIADSLAVGVYALLREDGDSARPSVHEVPTLAQVLERGAGVMIGRRVASFDEMKQPGDYFGPTTGFGEDSETCFFRGPACEHIGRVAFPPHTYRECVDGSLEIRASILGYAHGGCPEWHGYLDEGHVWRQV